MYNISNMSNNIDMSKFNDFLDNANNTLSCDSKCQEKRKKHDLKQQYLDAKTNLLTAPNQVETSYKNYLIYTQGDNAYNEYMDNELQQKAQIIATTFTNNFKDSINNVKTIFDTYSGLLLNFSHVVELHSNLVKENNKLTLEVKNKSSDVLTNDRKTFYEDQSIDSLSFYYIIFLIVYIIILLGFAVSIFLVPSATPRKSLLIILVFLIIYPFICTRLFLFLLGIYHRIISVLPTDVYKKI